MSLSAILGFFGGAGIIIGLVVKFGIKAYLKYVIKPGHIGNFARKAGIWLSAWGVKKFGAKDWEKMESEMVEKTISEFSTNFRAGLNYEE